MHSLFHASLYPSPLAVHGTYFVQCDEASSPRRSVAAPYVSSVGIPYASSVALAMCLIGLHVLFGATLFKDTEMTCQRETKSTPVVSDASCTCRKRLDPFVG